MDINDLRSIFTVVTFIVFVGIIWWAYSSHRKQAFDEAAMLPFDDDEPQMGNGKAGNAG
ncbi:MAG: cbb3-type cytochrome oxidase subunit 3 [Rhodocyclaceae bacterium]|nr:MAG: cbb3-type cytochrome oxidase subunit 3 [Rhodocyclaceae bacterium]